MLSWVEHGKSFRTSGPDIITMLKRRKCYFSRFNVKIPTTVGILTFISRKIFMLSWIKHETSFITTGSDIITMIKRRFSLADVWLYVAERDCFECEVVSFER